MRKSVCNSITVLIVHLFGNRSKLSVYCYDEYSTYHIDGEAHAQTQLLTVTS